MRCLERPKCPNLKTVVDMDTNKGIVLCPFVCLSVTLLFVPGGQTICLSPGGQTFLTHRWGGQTNCLSPGDKHFLYMGGTNIFLMMMIIVENVSGANIASSEARKPPAGARISGPWGPEILVI